MARPLIEIDGALVEKLAKIGCKTKEIADHFQCSEDTVTNRFTAELAKGRADLRMSLRQWQLASAQKGNVAMLIWLGKQMLGQVDKSELVLSKIDDETFIQEAQRRLADASKPSGNS
jgi:hypothetical protein